MLKRKKRAILDEIVKNNKFIGTSVDDALEKRLKEDEEFKILYEKEVFLNNISNAITDMREKEGFTQSDVAKKTGTTQPVIARLESSKNTRMPSLDLLSRIASSLGKKIVINFIDSNSDISTQRRKHC